MRAYSISIWAQQGTDPGLREGEGPTLYDGRGLEVILRKLAQGISRDPLTHTS